MGPLFVRGRASAFQEWTMSGLSTIAATFSAA